MPASVNRPLLDRSTATCYRIRVQVRPPRLWVCAGCGARFRLPADRVDIHDARVRCPACARVGRADEVASAQRRAPATGHWLGLVVTAALGLIAGAAPVAWWVATGATRTPPASVEQPPDPPPHTGHPAAATPASHSAVVARGRALLDSGDAEGAEAVLRRPVEAGAGGPALKYLGRSLRRLGRFEQADGVARRYRAARRPAER